MQLKEKEGSGFYFAEREMQDPKFIHALLVAASVLLLPACSTTSPMTTGSTTPGNGGGTTPPDGGGTATPTETMSTPSGLSNDVSKTLGDGKALSFTAEGKEINIPVHVSLAGGEGAPRFVADEDGAVNNVVIDGVTYKLTHESESESIEQGSAFALVMAGVGNDDHGAAFIGTGPAYGDTSDGADVKRMDILLAGTPTDPAKLPTAKADYVGEFSGAFLRTDDGGDVDQGTFTATADFGAAQSLTGSFVSDESGLEEATLAASISGNGFSGTVTPRGESGDFSAAGIFTGDGASGLVGAAQRGTATTFDVLVFEGTKQ